jgi:Rhodopirellula transposase DDE domain
VAFETLLELIGHTTTTTGLRVKAKQDTRRYKTGVIVTNAEMRALALEPHPFHGDWNYTVRPRAAT